MKKTAWIDEMQGIRRPILAAVLSVGFGIVACLICFLAGMKNNYAILIALFINSLLLIVSTGFLCKKFFSGACYMGTIISINTAFDFLAIGSFRLAIVCFVFCVIQIISYACVVGKPLRFDNSNDIYGAILWLIQGWPFLFIYWHFFFAFVFLALSIIGIILLIGEAKLYLWLKENAPTETEMEEIKYKVGEGAYRSSEVRIFAVRPQNRRFFFRFHRWLYQKYAARFFT